MFPAGSEGRELDKELLSQYNVLTLALDRLGQSYETVELTLIQLRRNLPIVIR